MTRSFVALVGREGGGKGRGSHCLQRRSKQTGGCLVLTLSIAHTNMHTYVWHTMQGKHFDDDEGYDFDDDGGGDEGPIY